ncbi:fungal-specific transcription factor domain-containing protein [Aspergillus spectabilis]
MEKPTLEREKIQRLAKACQRCRVRRIKCSGADPCVACDRSSQECVYRAEPPRRRRRALSPARLPHGSQALSHKTAQRVQPQLRTGLTVQNHETGAFHFYGSLSHFCFLHWIYLRLQRKLEDQDRWRTSTDTEGIRKWELSRFIFSSNNNGPSNTIVGPSESLALPFEVGSTFIECYFHRVHPLLPFLDHDRIRDIWMQSTTAAVVDIDPAEYSLLQMALAIGACVAGKGQCDNAESTEKWSQILLTRANEGMDLFGDPTLIKIQFTILRAVFSIQKCNLNESYMYLGHAARSALAAGLNRSQAVKGQSSACHAARITFWSLYILERTSALFSGRQSALRDDYIDTPFPDDSAVDRGASPFPSPLVHCSWIRSMADLAKVADKILQLSSPSTVPHSQDLAQVQQVVSDCDKLMDTMLQNLPSYLRFQDPAVPIGDDWQELQRAHLGFTYYLTNSVMHRPFLLFTSLYKTRQEAQNVAGDSVNIEVSIANAVTSSSLLIKLAYDVYYRRHPEVMYDAKMVSFLIYACVTLLYNVLEPDPEITTDHVREALEMVNLAIQCMSSTPNARTIGARKVGAKVVDEVKAAWGAAGHFFDMDDGMADILPWLVQLFPDAFSDESGTWTMLGEQLDPFAINQNADSGWRNPQ